MSSKTDLFQPVSTRLDLPETEERILQFWREIKAFEEGLERRKGSPLFVFYEGPPTANGLPGVHHVLSRTLKDIVCRYKSMSGFYVPRKGGWDTHGLPVEIAVERELGISGKDQIETFGIAEFNRRCRESVLRYESDWRRLTERIGYWLDMDHAYYTFDNSYIETVWWLLRQYWDQGFLYQGHKIVPYCPRCGTPLSSHEVSLGYEEVTEPSVTVKFPLVDEPGAFVLAWTTTPWTLPGNVALAVGPDIAYVRARQKRGPNEERYYLAKERLPQLEGEYVIEKEFKGRELAGRRYRPLFDFIDLENLTGKKGYYICEADFVTTEDGTGVVHTAVMYGEDDYQLGLRLDLPQKHTVDPQGRFTAEVKPWAGRNVKEVEKDIIAWLKEHGLLYRAEMTTHSYPFCWRCDSPLLYYAWKTWYIATTRYRDRMLEANGRIQWHPREIGANRFENWLENNVDWALSRNRYWGTPLPIWRCEGCGQDRCVGSVAELLQGEGAPEPLDLHRPYVDQITFPCEKCGGRARRVPEVIDVWFDSGSMPFAQWHYPFENAELLESYFPADYISEGMDQTRGWFYTLMAIGVFAKGTAPYKHVLVNELILDKEGKKMSKSRGNVVDPDQVLNLRGADALRFYLISTSPPWTATRFDPEGVTEVAKKLMGTLKNTAQFFALYANIDGYEPARKERSKPSLLDRWVLSRLHTLVATCREALEGYDLTRGARAIQDFVLEDLSNWYVRRSRRRFWKSGDPADKRAAYDTLLGCLETVSRLLAPYTPFVAEELHQSLVRPARPEAPKSVHWCDYPVADRAAVDEGLERAMYAALRIVNLGRAARNVSSLRVRQPLRRLAVAGLTEKERERIGEVLDLVRDELNVREIVFPRDRGDLLQVAVKPNYPVLGKKAGAAMKELASKVQSAPPDEVRAKVADGGWEVEAGGQRFTLTQEDVTIQESSRAPWVAQADAAMTVAVDTTLDEELRAEGLVREFAHRIQMLRKSAEFEVTDRIRLFWELSPGLASACARHEGFIKEEVLAEEVVPRVPGNGPSEEWTFDGERARVGIERVHKGG
ncbi:MAG: isoleucine--tRNA ligase [Candidatus Eisenbacteria bacterium]|uniref:Isoleucine--tRNA ligase n=1 Tax=Eiseniibacteriota bacterium TaxID=2212470 RepID=A0A538S752_UNCEI|nr:MAG: isoleucine--tRNA ligase [Candidatus Eisenbacteria bacterium]